ncbi:amino acid adenylation domain-containing protein [Thermithiobacillus tepidarius DSM 3134]|uniref:non-ribosomal peptide synthetase n=1 Tax=Thermithiobacillus tepidarius TaxID=929 RepID=UPI0003FC73D2|nr:non-ribosomal peptide synthetase [Thermithiobacillus tepidarius]
MIDLADMDGELSPEKRALLALLLAEEEARAAAEAPADEAPRRRDRGTGPCPLSFAQKRLWFIDQLEPGNPFYNIPIAIRLRGPLHLPALESALRHLVQRHESLRTTFAAPVGQPVQVIAPALDLPLPVTDLGQLPADAREAEARRLARAEAETPFDLERGPLLRCALLRLGTDEHILMLTMHHIISDGWSTGVFYRELAACYDAFAQSREPTLPELPLQYADFTLWQQDWLRGPELERQLAYWREQLGGKLPVLQLPSDRPRPAVQSHRGAEYRFRLSAQLTQSLKSLGQQEGATLFMVLLAAFNVLLFRYTGAEDLIVGSPIANRSRVELEGLIGFFVNTLALRTRLDGGLSFRQLLARVKESTLGAYAHQDLPFEKLVEVLQPERSLSHNPLFQVMFVLQSAPMQPLALHGLSTESLEVDSGTAKFDLLLSMTDRPEGLSGSLGYSSDLFDEATIVRLVSHFETLLEGIVAAPQNRVDELPLLPAAERRRLLGDWNATRTDYPAERCLHQLFEAQAQSTPDAPAALFQGESLSYAELNRRANQLAHTLQGLGIGPDDRVGICVTRSLDLLVAVLGVLKAGAAYVPLDPSYPPERLAYMLEDAGAPVLLTQARLLPDLPAHGARTLCLDRDWDRIAQAPTHNPEPAVTPEHLAYVIYTSGSTGQPKGVAMGQRPLLNLLAWQVRNSTLPRGAKTLQFASLSFDVSFQEIFSTWCAGGTLVLIPEDTRRDMWALAQTLKEHRVARLFLPFVALEHLAEVIEESGILPTSLREVVTAGEQLQVTGAVQRLFERLDGCILQNQYGPSESHVVTAHTLAGPPADWPRLPPIGRPIANCRIYLLDGRRQPVPIGIPGELYIGGPVLARGYLNRPELSAERFLPDPFQPGGRLYKTGDLARYLPDGNIEFLGRIDHQVKIRGFRIELGEIEAVLSQHPAVRTALVTVREDQPGRRRLAAYVLAEDPGNAPAAGELRAFLQERLPEYMVPAAFVVLATFPLTPSGKVDRKALPAPGDALDAREEGFLAPCDAVERQLAEIWEELLGVKPVGVRDNFFELGGHSLLAVRLFARIDKQFGKRLPLATLFKGATIEHLAGLVRQMETAARHGHLVEIRPHGGKRPLFCIHPIDGSVLWYVDLARHLDPDQPIYGFEATDPAHVQLATQPIETMAARYIEEMRAVQPQGPYLLLGFSSGGAVAFEMARQLHAQGERIAMLGVIDTNPVRITGYRHAARDLNLLYGIFNAMQWKWVKGLMPRLAKKTRQWCGLEAPGEYDMQHQFEKSAGEWIFELPEHRRRFVKTHSDTLMDYVPKAFPGHVTLFRTRKDALAYRCDPQLGWSRLAQSGVTVRTIPGKHSTLLKEPNVGILAQALTDCLAQAEDATAPEESCPSLYSLHEAES